MAYNKETEEIIAGGKGFVETWKISGKEVSCRTVFNDYTAVTTIVLSVCVSVCLPVSVC